MTAVEVELVGGRLDGQRQAARTSADGLPAPVLRVPVPVDTIAVQRQPDATTPHPHAQFQVVTYRRTVLRDRDHTWCYTYEGEA